MALVMAGTLLAGLLVVGLGAGHARRYDHQDLGVVPRGPVATLARGQAACQTPVALTDAVDRVVVFVGPGGQERGPWRVSLRDGGVTGRVLASQDLPRVLLPPNGAFGLQLDRPVSGDRDVALCVANRGADPLDVVGDIDSHTGVARPVRVAGRVLDNPTRTLDDLTIIDRKHPRGQPKQGFELEATFPFAEPHSLLSRIPAALRHAVTFKGAFVGAWLYWVLAVLALLAPVALARALGSAEASDYPEPR